MDCITFVVKTYIYIYNFKVKVGLISPGKIRAEKISQTLKLKI